MSDINSHIAIMGKLVKLIIIFVLCLAFLGFVFWQGILPCEQGGVFEVKEGEGLLQIAENLKEQGFIQMEIPFYLYVFLEDGAKDLKYGVYRFTADDTFLSIAQKIIQGDTYTIKITIPEGYNIEQIDTRLAGAGLIEKEKFINFDTENFQFSTLPSSASRGWVFNFHVSGLEGFLFPDTYYFSPFVTTEEIARVFLDNFDKKLTSDLREEIERQDKEIFEIITMASLLEKEIRATEDKKMVSGILWKRLESGMPLQVDATIIYITGKKTTKVSISETKIDSPYNTYRYRGLPVSPICNPGLDSIRAAIYPESSKYWYYLSTPQGETIFSRTLKEHNIAKAKYLR